VSVSFNKDSFASLSVAEKIKLIRISKNMTQSDIAEIISSNQAKVSKIENGEDEYRQEELDALKKGIKIENMPLTESDCLTFEKSLFYWRDVIRSKQMEEASKLREKMSVIVELEPFSYDLSLLYRLFEFMHLFTEGNIIDAEERLGFLDDKLDKMRLVQTYYYYYNKGSLCIYNKNYKEALIFYEKALELKREHKELLPEEEKRLYHNMARCYSDIEIPNRTTYHFNTPILIKAESSSISDITYFDGIEFFGDTINKIFNPRKAVERSFNNPDASEVKMEDISILFRPFNDYYKEFDTFIFGQDVQTQFLVYRYIHHAEQRNEDGSISLGSLNSAMRIKFNTQQSYIDLKRYFSLVNDLLIFMAGRQNVSFGVKLLQKIILEH